MRRFLSYFLVLFAIISCGCYQSPTKLRTIMIGKYSIDGVRIGNIYDSNSQSFYSIIANGSALKICDRKTGSLVFSELELPGAVISSYDAGNEFYMICKSQNNNLLVCFLYDGAFHKLELNKKFEINTRSSEIIGVLGLDTVITQSEDKTTLYLHDDTKGNLINIIKYPRPTIWWETDMGFDGQDLIFRTGYENGLFEEIREKISDKPSIDKSFFQMKSNNYEFVDLYDGEKLWRINTHLNLSGNIHIKGPLKIKNLKRGFNQILYPYEKGLCRVEISKIDSSKLVLNHIDNRNMYPVEKFLNDLININKDYYFYGYEENGVHKLKCYKFFSEDVWNNERMDYEECDVDTDSDSIKTIAYGDDFNLSMDYSNVRDVSFVVFLNDEVYYIPDATNW